MTTGLSNTWTISSDNEGDIAGLLTFTKIQNLMGGTSADGTGIDITDQGTGIILLTLTAAVEELLAKNIGLDSSSK